MTECRVCGEGIWTEQLDFIDGIPLYYVSCSYCKGEYGTQKHINLNRAAKLKDVHSKSLAAVDKLFANMTDEEFISDFEAINEKYEEGTTAREYLAKPEQ
jgi:hypothetical protein